MVERDCPSTILIASLVSFTDIDHLDLMNQLVYYERPFGIHVRTVAIVQIMSNQTMAHAETVSLDSRKFAGVENSATGEVGQSTTFTYHEEDDVIWAEYSGGAVIRGYLVGTRSAEKLHFRYAHLGTNKETSTGVCDSIIEVLGDGRVRFHESWAWESRPETGSSIVEELKR